MFHMIEPRCLIGAIRTYLGFRLFSWAEKIASFAWENCFIGASHEIASREREPR